MDEQLLDDLGGDPVERELLKDNKPRETKNSESDVKRPDLEKQLQRELGDAATPGADSDPVLEILRRMRLAERHMAQADCGPRTQQAQDEILAELDKLIEKAKKSCNCSGSCSSKPSDKPCDKPGSKSGKPKPGGSGKAKLGANLPVDPIRRPSDMPDRRAVLKELWGQLPAHERQRMLELPVDEFLPEYELQIEDYFRRLSEEKEK